MISRFDTLAKEASLSRRTHSHSWDKDGYVTITTEVASVDNIPRSELFQHVFKCKKSETYDHIMLARDLATASFLAVELNASDEEEAPDAPVVELKVAEPVAETPVVEEKKEEEKPKRKRAPRKPKEEAVAPEAVSPEAVYTAPVEDDGLGLGEDEEQPKPAIEFYKKGDKAHGKILGALLIDAYGAEWQKDAKVKNIVRGLVAVIKDVVPVVDSEGVMLKSFHAFVADFLKKAA